MTSELRYVVVIFVLILSISAKGQTSLDSLKAIEIKGLTLSDRFSTLNEIIRASINNEDSTIKYARILFDESYGLDTRYAVLANLYIGQAFKAQGDYEQSLKYLLDGLKYSKDDKLNEVTMTKTVLAALYAKLGEMENMHDYYLSAIKTFLRSSTRNDSIQAAITFNNLAEGYYENQQYDSALYYYQNADKLCKKLSLHGFRKIIDGSIGMIYVKWGNYEEAELRLKEGIQFTRKSGVVISETMYLIHLAEVYMKTDRMSDAEQSLQLCLDLSIKNDLKEQVRDASKLLSELYYHANKFERSLDLYKQYELYKDSIENIEAVKTIANMRKEFEVGQKQAEVDVLTAEKRIQQIILITVGAFALIFIVLAAVIYNYYRSKARINKILEDQKRELESLNQTKDKFFSIISHDLRGPVTSFMGISRMIKFLVKSKKTDQLLEVADNIDESVERLSNLLDNLLTWAMQQQGHFPNVPEKLHLNEMVDDLVKTLSTMAQGKQIKLKSEISEDIHLWADKNTTMTIFRNLVNNALKFTPEGGSVTIGGEQENDHARIYVMDNGVGIPQDKLNNLFKLEDKKSTYGTGGEKGLGLGLQLVYEFIDMNNGSIKVESEEVKGTTFTIKLPLFESVKAVGEKV